MAILCGGMFGCSQTSIIITKGRPYLRVGQGLLISQIEGFGLYRSEACFKILEENLEPKFGQLIFQGHVEYDLIASGLTPDKVNNHR